MWRSLTLSCFLYTFCIVSNPLLQICDSEPTILLIAAVWLLLHLLCNNFWKLIRYLKIKTEHILLFLCLVLLGLPCGSFLELCFACSIWATTITPSLNTRLLWMLCILFLSHCLFRHAWYWFWVLDSKLLKSFESLLLYSSFIFWFIILVVTVFTRIFCACLSFNHRLFLLTFFPLTRDIWRSKVFLQLTKIWAAFSTFASSRLFLSVFLVIKIAKADFFWRYTKWLKHFTFKFCQILLVVKSWVTAVPCASLLSLFLVNLVNLLRSFNLFFILRVIYFCPFNLSVQEFHKIIYLSMTITWLIHVLKEKVRFPEKLCQFKLQSFLPF